ncbi:ABC transporter permease [Paenibacillus donghaensis]|uniref:ABC3 transporter permease C-terminal domain-containing protein n=1 Tax=Paenibacillus donghaensis TaxID=414771 RepID=A0A2Z2K662_9BACL|nr:ABC transporter permease [Paenibacillus donghaensis]ASA20197.1 hypothetical protein B9T62_04910 [Paenibacillus donghaensis]
MLSYSFRSLIYNRNKYILLSLLSVLAFGFIYFILAVLGLLISPSADGFAEEAQQSFLVLMIGFVVIFTLSVSMVISTVFYMFYTMRKPEMKVLRTLGASRATLNRTYLIEMSLLSLIISLISFLCGSAITAVFFTYYQESYVWDGRVVLIFFLLSNAVFLSMAYRQFTKVLREIDGVKKGRARRTKGQAGNKLTARLVTGCVFVGLGLSSIAYPRLQDAFTLIGVMILIKPLIGLLLYGLEQLLHSLRASSLLLAVQQMRFNFNKISSLVANVAVSLALIVMMFSLYHSLESSAVEYSARQMQYDAVAQLNQPVQDTWLQEQKGLEGTLAYTAGVEPSGRSITLTGISKTFTASQTLDFKSGSLDDLWKSAGDKQTAAVIPESLSINAGLDIGDTLNLKVQDRLVTLTVAGTFYSYNLNQIYVDKEQLAGQLATGGGQSNLLYVQGPLPEAEAALKNGAPGGYQLLPKDELLEGYREGILNGTEMVETFLYVYLVISVFLIINMFVMSMEERSRVHAGLRVLGVRKSRLIWMNVFEAALLIVAGSVAGAIIGWLLNSGVPSFVESSFGVRVSISEPLPLLLIVFGAAQLLTIAFPALLGVISMNGRQMLLVDKEE